MRGREWSDRRCRGRVGKVKEYRVRRGRAGKCRSVTGEIDGDGWAWDRADVEKKRSERKEPRESRGRRMEFGQGLRK